MAEAKRNTLTPVDVKNKVGQLMERRSRLQCGAEPLSPDYTALEITKGFEELSERTGVSVAALEFLYEPVGLVGRGAGNLTRVGNVFEDLNVEWAEELRKAGLV